MNDTATTDVWPTVHSVRAALAADLADLTDAQWATPTLTKGLTLRATDRPFTHGDGPLVSGPTLALTMAVAGRGTYCDDLTGDGVPILRARISGPAGPPTPGGGPTRR